MATLEDRILGEKLQYYCSSSSEDEDEPAENDGSPSHVPASEKAPPPPPELKQREGCSSVNVSAARTRALLSWPRPTLRHGFTSRRSVFFVCFFSFFFFCSERRVGGSQLSVETLHHPRTHNGARLSKHADGRRCDEERTKVYLASRLFALACCSTLYGVDAFFF